MLAKLTNDLENARRKLHKFIDDYMDNLKNSLMRKIKGELGDSNNISKILEEVRQMIIDLRVNEKKLYSNQILPAIKKIIVIDPDEYIRILRAKLGMIDTETTAIDLVLDDSEMQELLGVLQRIVSLGKKTVNNYQGLDKLKANINPAVDTPTANYFHRKFYNQENLTFDKAANDYNANLQIAVGGADAKGIRKIATGAGGGVWSKTVISGKEFFDMTSVNKYFCHYSPKMKELSIVDVEMPDAPRLVGVKMLNSKQLKIDSRTSFIQRPDGMIYFTGGVDDSKDRPHPFCFVYNLLTGDVNQIADMSFSRCSHSILQHSKYIYVAGGRSDGNNPQKTFERYDTILNYWEKLPDCLTPGIRNLLVLLNDNTILKFGGLLDGTLTNVLEKYDIAKKEWSSLDYVIKEDESALKGINFKFWPGMAGIQISFNSVLVFGGMDNHLNPLRQSFIFSAIDNSGPRNATVYKIDNINKQNLSKQISFSSSQAIIHKNAVLSFSDIIDSEAEDKMNIEKRNLCSFDGLQWNFS